MASSRFYTAYVEKMRLEGIDAFHASQLDGAFEANEQDRMADWQHEMGKTTADFLKSAGKDTFDSVEEQKIAFADPLYSKSAAYRAACHSMMAGMSESRVRIAKDGENVLDEVSDHTMLQAAEDELARSQYRHLVKESATNPETRLVLLQLLQSEDEGTKTWIAKGTGAISGANDRPLDKASREGGGGTYGPDLNKAMSGGTIEESQNGPVTDAEANAAGPK
jgi:hypothetical protein